MYFKKDSIEIIRKIGINNFTHKLILAYSKIHIKFASFVSYNMLMKLNADQIRKLEEERAQGSMKQVKRNPIYFVLENIYDTYNIGGLFRLADALAIEKIYLCGDSEIPPNARIKKASIGTYKVVPWEYRKSAKEAIDSLKLEVRGEKLENEVRSEKKNIKLPTSK